MVAGRGFLGWQGSPSSRPGPREGGGPGAAAAVGAGPAMPHEHGRTEEDLLRADEQRGRGGCLGAPRSPGSAGPGGPRAGPGAAGVLRAGAALQRLLRGAGQAAVQPEPAVQDVLPVRLLGRLQANGGRPWGPQTPRQPGPPAGPAGELLPPAAVRHQAHRPRRPQRGHRPLPVHFLHLPLRRPQGVGGGLPEPAGPRGHHQGLRRGAGLHPVLPAEAPHGPFPGPRAQRRPGPPYGPESQEDGTAHDGGHERAGHEHGAGGRPGPAGTEHGPRAGPAGSEEDEGSGREAKEIARLVRELTKAKGRRLLVGSSRWRAAPAPASPGGIRASGCAAPPRWGRCRRRWSRPPPRPRRRSSAPRHRPRTAAAPGTRSAWRGGWRSPGRCSGRA
mmetsp:Transcript_1494/g.2060  ORF Transcript_1494/g.2060 Transcript_1494/m.2060 type:complete len:389 (+) Transcript_1494:1369-2535(+)